MSAVIDFCAVQEARAALRQLAADHPELCAGGRRWSNHLDELESAMTTVPGTPARVEKYRGRLRAAGRRQVALWLTPEADAALAALRATSPGVSLGDLVSAAILAAMPAPGREGQD